MKRLGLLVFSVLFALAGLNAQTIVLEEDFSLVAADSNHSIGLHLDDYTHVPGWTGNWVYSSTEKVRVGKGSEDGFIMTPALDLSGNNGNFTVTFDAKAWNNDKTKMFVEVNGVDNLVEGLSTTQFNTFTLEFTGGNNATTVKFKSFQTSNARFFLDNIVITSQDFGPDTVAPVLTNVIPSENSLAVSFNEALDPTTAEDISNYMLDNDISVTNASLNNNIVTLTVFPALTEGITYTLTANNVADVAGNVMQSGMFTFTFGVAPEFHVASIAELREKLDYSDINQNYADSIEYKLTGEVIVTAIAAHNNQKVLQDSTGAILVYDPDNKFGALEVGDKVKDLYGTLNNYFGFLEFKPTAAYGSRVDVYQDVNSLTITLEQLNDASFMANHQAELIKLENVSFTTTGVFTIFNTYGITQDGVNANAVYPYFQDADIVGSSIPTGTIDIVGFNFATAKIGSNFYDYRYYIVPRSVKDFGTGLPQYLTENDIVVYPNPVADQLNISLHTNAFEATSMCIFDINGKLILSQPVNGNQIVMNANGLAAGSYLLRLSDGKNSVTTKFVKK